MFQGSFVKIVQKLKNRKKHPDEIQGGISYGNEIDHKVGF